MNVDIESLYQKTLRSSIVKILADDPIHALDNFHNNTYDSHTEEVLFMLDLLRQTWHEEGMGFDEASHDLGIIAIVFQALHDAIYKPEYDPMLTHSEDLIVKKLLTKFNN